MSESNQAARFEELEAGRILGDLDADEVREWESLAVELNAGPDLSLELVAAAVETEFLQDLDESVPSELEALLRNDVGSYCNNPAKESSRDNIIRPALWQRVLASSEGAWAIAAVLLALLVATMLTKQPESTPAPIADTSPTEISPLYAKTEFEKKAKDLTKAAFGGLGSYEGMSGEVIWSDEKQEGYMTLTNLPTNDPTRSQYQLWIVDPARDEKPVDGGVFDIPAGKSTAIVPINNPLVVKNPQAFVITLEQPGGVVVSKQEVVVALAKPS